MNASKAQRLLLLGRLLVGRWAPALRRFFNCPDAFNQGVNEGLRLAIDRIKHFEVGEFNKSYRERLIAELAKELHA